MSALCSVWRLRYLYVEVSTIIITIIIIMGNARYMHITDIWEQLIKTKILSKVEVDGDYQSMDGEYLSSFNYSLY